MNWFEVQFLFLYFFFDKTTIYPFYKSLLGVTEPLGINYWLDLEESQEQGSLS